MTTFAPTNKNYVFVRRRVTIKKKGKKRLRTFLLSFTAHRLQSKKRKEALACKAHDCYPLDDHGKENKRRVIIKRFFFFALLLFSLLLVVVCCFYVEEIPNKRKDNEEIPNKNKTRRDTKIVFFHPIQKKTTVLFCKG